MGGPGRGRGGRRARLRLKAQPSIPIAHPDDEQLITGLLTRAKQRDGAFTALVAATRGEAGRQSPVVARQRELGEIRKAELLKMEPKGTFTRAEFTVPARGLIGVRTRLLNATGGQATMHHVFHGYGPYRGDIEDRVAGVLVSMSNGAVTFYSLDNLRDRGQFFVPDGETVYEGQIVGLHSRGNDLVVNPTKAKQLTNIRAAGSDEALILTPPVRHSLEQALEFIEDDELVEVTPESIRLRKKLLLEHERKRASRG